MRVRLQSVDHSHIQIEWKITGSSFCVGRSPECDFVFSGAGADPVSGEHAKLMPLEGSLSLFDQSSTNGTYVNEQPTSDDGTILKTGDVVAFGKTGPRFEIIELDTVKVVASPPPEISGASEPSATRQILIHLQSKQGKWLKWGIGVVTIGAIAIAMTVHKVETTELQVGDLVDGVSDLSNGIDDLADGNRHVTQRVDQMAKNNPVYIMKKYGDAVYFVKYSYYDSATRRTKGWVATAFAIDATGLFGTNAHVAKPINDLRRMPHFKATVISQGGSNQYDVISAIPHPHYLDINLPDTFTPDVGLLRVAIPKGKSITTVKLASADEIESLAVGMPLCYAGFPVFKGTDYSALKTVVFRVYTGTLNRLLTMDKEMGTARDSRLIEHSMFSWGGASGSPIFNRDGKVVAVHAAGSLLSYTDDEGKQRLRKAAASAKYAIRIDYLKELIANQN